jgi:SPP1 family predicted phage head-tail adaptor
MRAGQLKHRVIPDEPVATQDETGAEIVTWTPREEMLCAIEPIGGREALRAGATIADMDTRITTRWSPFVSTINAKWRLRHVRDVGAGPIETIYNVKRPPAEKNLAQREVEFMCQTGLNLG